MDEVEITIIGAGVIGLAIAAELSKTYDNIVLIERHESFGQEISSRNSEVIHAGIYYPSGSMKARLSVEGVDLLYRYCEEYKIPYSRLGKMIVAREQAELSQLNELFIKGAENGVKGLSIIEKKEISKIEPNVKAIAAIHSPNTGIVDSHSLMKTFFNSANSSGVMFSFNTEVNMLERVNGGYVLGVKNDDYKFISKAVINSAGLSSDHIAELAGIDVESLDYRLRYCKGSYFSYSKASPVQMLVYPIPHKDLAGLGVHATLDLGGRLRFGPDAEYIDKLDYKISSNKRDFFYEGASSFIKGLDKESLIPDMVGIRPKIKGEGIKDFVIRQEADNGFDGFINLIGIESPGLTASLSIAKYVRGITDQFFNSI